MESWTIGVFMYVAGWTVFFFLMIGLYRSEHRFAVVYRKKISNLSSALIVLPVAIGFSVYADYLVASARNDHSQVTATQRFTQARSNLPVGEREPLDTYHAFVLLGAVETAMTELKEDAQYRQLTDFMKFYVLIMAGALIGAFVSRGLGTSEAEHR